MTIFTGPLDGEEAQAEVPEKGLPIKRASQPNCVYPSGARTGI